MTLNARKAGCLALLLLAAPARPLQAGSLWKRLMAGLAVAAVWATGSAQPDDPPAPARPHPAIPLRLAPAGVRFSHFPPCFPTLDLPPLHAALDAARAHYPPGLCPKPLPEHLPHERDEPEAEETAEELVASLATRSDCQAYEAEVEAGIGLLEREAACALERARTSRRRDRGERLVEELEDVTRQYDNLAQVRRRARSMVDALEDARWNQRYRPQTDPGTDRLGPPDGLADPAETEILSLEERLVCATGCLQDLDLALKRCLREVFPAGMAMLPEAHPFRKKLKHDYCHTVDQEWFDAHKHLAPATGNDPAPQRWILDSPVLD